MGLQTDSIGKASDAINNFTEKGITVNVDNGTIQSAGVYLLLMGLVTGFTAAFFNFLFNKFFKS
jgi:hypothetical protein